MGELPWYEALSFGVTITPFCWRLQYDKHAGMRQLGIDRFCFHWSWK
jgi:hypothetical protein